MKTLKKISCFSLLLLLSIGLLSSIKVQALDDINIISTTKVTAEEAKIWARRKNATDTFIGLADLYWKYSKTHGNVNPTMAYVQAAVETGYGKFGGVIDESYKNPCGMKTSKGGSNTDPNAHQRFNTWDDGVNAHLDHLALYAGASGYPRENTTDPRHFSYIFGKAKTVQALSKAWASNANYGNTIMNLYNSLVAVSNEVRILENLETKEITSSGGDITIKGWAISKSNISAIKVYINDKLIGNATLGISRPDVKNAYPSYPNAEKSGYSLKFNTSNLSNGAYKIKVVYEGSKGNKISSEGTLNIAKNQNDNNGGNTLPSIGNIDYPLNGITTNTSSIKVEGWTLCNSVIKEVKIYIDGKYVKSATLGISRPDVAKVYPAYINANKSGYSAILDSSEVSYGKRTITVESIGLNGETLRNSTTFNYEKKQVVVIDAGHGGTDPGAVSGSRIEKTLNLNIALKTEVELKNRGYLVKMVRANDSTVSLKDRANFANKLNADLFISIHQNSFTNSSANGTEVYYTTSKPDAGFPSQSSNKLSKSKEIAKLTCDNISSAIGTYNRGIKDGNLTVLRNTKMPSILIECGFITNNSDVLKTSSDSYQNKIAKAVAYAVDGKKYVNMSSNLSVNSFTAGLSSPQTVGTDIELKALASGGIGNLEYKFIFKDENGNWSIIRNYASTNSYVWTPSKKGNYELYVDVKDSYGNVVRKGMNYKINEASKPEITSFTTDKASPQISSTVVKLTANAKGTGSLKYKFLLKSEDGNWHVIRDYSESNTCQWKTGLTGNKTLYVDVKDSYGNVVRKGMNYKINEVSKPEITSFTTDKASPQTSSTVVKLTANAKGTGSLKYKFLLKSEDGNWYLIRDYSESNTCQWKTGLTGNKTLYVDVKDSYGNVVRKAMEYKIR